MAQEHNMIPMDCFNKLEGPSNYMVWKGKIKTILLKEKVCDVVKAIDNEINVASNTIIVEVVYEDEEIGHDNLPLIEKFISKLLFNEQ
jgi:hypothetical protein